MKIEDLHDCLDLIYKSICQTKTNIVYLNSCLECDIKDSFNKHVCKTILIAIDSFMDNSEDVIDGLIMLKDKIHNIRDGL